MLFRSVPRHPQRGREVADRVRAQGLRVALRSAAEAPECDIYVADTLGELGLFYRLAPIVFLGGSLVPVGGHNPLEPARLQCATLMGPHRASFQAMCDALIAAGALIPVADEADLSQTLGELLDHPDRVSTVGRHAQDYATRQADVLPRILTALEPYLRAL